MEGYDVFDRDAAEIVWALIVRRMGAQPVADGLAMEIVQALRNEGWQQPDGIGDSELRANRRQP